MKNQETYKLRITNKHFKIDFDKVKTLDDVILILKAMDIHVHWYQETFPPEQFKEIYDKGLLIEQHKN